MDHGSSNSRKILFVLVCYKEKYWETISFLNLVKSHKINGDGEVLSIFIVDNTDLPDWNAKKVIDDDKIKISYCRLDQNPGISAAYNKAYIYACENSYEWLVFMDQDTALPNNFYFVYYSAAKRNNFLLPIKLPIIYYAEGKILSPAKYINYRSYPMKVSIHSSTIVSRKVSTINTGLMVSTKFYKQNGKYNENLRLDFCDHDFIERAKMTVKKFEILPLTLNQDFSSHTDDIFSAISRYKLYLRDLQVYKNNRCKLKIFLFVDLPRVLRLTFKFKTLEFIKIRINQNNSQQ